MKLQLSFINNIIISNLLAEMRPKEHQPSKMNKTKYKAKVILKIRESHLTTNRTEVSSSENSKFGLIDPLLTALIK
jgi:hypothetical protein